MMAMIPQQYVEEEGKIDDGEYPSAKSAVDAEAVVTVSRMNLRIRLISADEKRMPASVLRDERPRQ